MTLLSQDGRCGNTPRLFQRLKQSKGDANRLLMTSQTTKIQMMHIGQLPDSIAAIQIRASALCFTTTV
jgi:hypothetical protein